MGTLTGKRQVIPQRYTADRRTDQVFGAARVCVLGLMRKASSERLVRQALAREGGPGLMNVGRDIPQWVR
jgi:hypothetical protein